MKLETNKQVKAYQKTLLRAKKAIGYEKPLGNHIEWIRWIWDKAKSKGEAKSWFQVELSLDR